MEAWRPAPCLSPRTDDWRAVRPLIEPAWRVELARIIGARVTIDWRIVALDRCMKPPPPRFSPWALPGPRVIGVPGRSPDALSGPPRPPRSRAAPVVDGRALRPVFSRSCMWRRNVCLTWSSGAARIRGKNPAPSHLSKTVAAIRSWLCFMGTPSQTVSAE